MRGQSGALILSAALAGVLAAAGCGGPRGSGADGEGGTGDGRQRAPATATAQQSATGELATVRVGALPPLRVEVARTPQERSQGLSGRDRLPPARGMIFVFDSPTTSGFWMHDVYFPLSLAWVRDGRVIGTVEMTPCTTAPDDCRTYEPPGPFDMAIEAPADTFDDVQPGTKVEVDAPGG